MNPHFKELQAHYQIWLSTLGFSKAVVYNYPKILGFFFDFLEQKGIFNLSQISQNHIQQYHEHLQTRENKRKKNQTLSTTYLNKSFDVVDKFIEFLHQREAKITIVPSNYRILHTQKDWQEKVKVISQAEVKKLYDSVDELFTHFSYAKAEPRKALATLILDLCYGCGLRRSEAYFLTINDIDLDKKLLFIRQGKGYKDRYVPMNERVCERMQMFIYQHRKAWKISHNRLIPLSKDGIYAYFKSIRKASGLSPEISLHTLRHSIATHLLQNGMKVEQISKFLGHSSLDSTQVYTHLV
jgi:integrase/recombinase XerD